MHILRCNHCWVTITDNTIDILVRNLIENYITITSELSAETFLVIHVSCLFWLHACSTYKCYFLRKYHVYISSLRFFNIFDSIFLSVFELEWSKLANAKMCDERNPIQMCWKTCRQDKKMFFIETKCVWETVIFFYQRMLNQNRFLLLLFAFFHSNVI